MSRSIFAIFIVTLNLFGCNNPQAVERIKDDGLVQLLSAVEIAADKQFDNFSLRALSLREDGECDGSLSTCPKLEYYLVISTFDEAPDRAAYRLPPSHDWKIEKIEEIDSYGEYQRFLIITLTRTVAPSDQSDKQWVKREYKIKINPWKYEVIKEIKGPNQ